MGIILTEKLNTFNRMRYLDRKMKEIRRVQEDRLYSKHEKAQWMAMMPFYEQRYKMEERRLLNGHERI